MRWLLNTAYLLLLMAVSPVLLYRMLAQGKYRDGWKQKFLGRLPRRYPAESDTHGSKENRTTRLWFHAVSVGEVLQLQTVIEEIRQRRDGVEFVITTTTSTGLSVAKDKFPDLLVCYFPLDFSWAVRRAFASLRPDVVVLVELELWPNFILEAERTGTPLALINGRIGAKSFLGYRRIRPLMKRLLGCFRLLAVQNETYKQRLLELGAPADRIEVTGSVKFDRVQADPRNPETEELRRTFGLQNDERVLIAGSTQAPEEEYALNTWMALRRNHPELRLILVPRHQERFEQVAELIEERGLPLIRRSQILKNAYPENDDSAEADSEASENESQLHAGSNKPSGWLGSNEVSPQTLQILGARKASTPATHQKTGFETASKAIPPVLLLDTLGELSACWGLADVAFVGGSLTGRGGQNMIEPAAYGAAVLFGPNTWNFQDIVELLLSENAARRVTDPDDLTATVRFLLENSHIAENHGQLARKLVLSQQGATAKTVDAVCKLLPEKIQETDTSLRNAA